MRTTFACQPEDFEQLPWVPSCERCERLRSDAHPGQVTWVEIVAEHFDAAHDVLLVGV